MKREGKFPSTQGVGSPSTLPWPNSKAVQEEVSSKFQKKEKSLRKWVEMQGLADNSCILLDLQNLVHFLESL